MKDLTTDQSAAAFGGKMHAEIEELRKLAASGKEIPKLMVMGAEDNVEALKTYLVAQ